MSTPSPLAFALLAGAGFASLGVHADTVWREQGPGPIYRGSNVAIRPGSPQAGGVSAVAPSPTDANLLYAGTVNGGVWRSSDAASVKPHWTPLTDQALPALSIASLTISPANDKIVFAGTGSLSALANVGSRGFGIARSLDGGASWSVLGAARFSGRPVTEVALAGATLLAGTRRSGAPDTEDPDADMAPAAVAAATPSAPKYGLYRSENALNPKPGMVVFKAISGAGKGLPPGGISALAADPVHKANFYASISARDGSRSTAGVYFSRDTGATWTRINGADAQQLTSLDRSERILLSVHADAKAVAVYAAVIDRDGTLSGVFRTTDRGRAWMSMGVPSPAIFPGGQGNLHGALAADPNDPNVVFISGDRQDLPNAEGCKSYVGAIFRGDAATAGSGRWHSVVCKNAQGTAPHADSRALAFTARGNLVETDDGGIYQLNRPNGAAPEWTSLIGDIRPTEFHSIAYDPLSKVIFGGAQDNGVPVQSKPNSLAWAEFAGGDGGVVAVDADLAAHPGKSIRYTAYVQLESFQRSTWNASNDLLGTEPVALRIVAGSPCKQILSRCDGTAKFYTPIVLNTIDPSRMLIGTNSLYESLDRGDRLTDLGNLGDSIGGASEFGQPMVYGGRSNGKVFPAMLYVGAGANLFHRVERSGPVRKLPAYKGGEISTVAVNPFDYRQVFVLDAANQIWFSLDEGAHFASMTGNLRQLTDKIGTLTVYATDGLASHVTVIAGGFGIFQAKADGAPATWTPLAAGFPHVLVGDLHYDGPSDTLVAGTLGRGAWSLTGFFTGARTVSVAKDQPLPAPFGNEKTAHPALPVNRAIETHS